MYKYKTKVRYSTPNRFIKIILRIGIKAIIALSIAILIFMYTQAHHLLH